MNTKYSQIKDDILTVRNTVCAIAKNASFKKVEEHKPMGQYKETDVDTRKKKVDFLIKSIDGAKVTIDWNNGKRETVTKKDLETLKQSHTWMTDF
jgi:hypothetical protein